MQNKCLGEEQKEHQQSLEAQDKCKLWLPEDRNLAREKEQERRRREAVSEFEFTKSNKGIFNRTVSLHVQRCFQGSFSVTMELTL